jgi:hypothetical protein
LLPPRRATSLRREAFRRGASRIAAVPLKNRGAGLVFCRRRASRQSLFFGIKRQKNTSIENAEKMPKNGEKFHVVQNAQNENLENRQKDEAEGYLFALFFTERLHFCDLPIPFSEKTSFFVNLTKKLLTMKEKYCTI